MNTAEIDFALIEDRAEDKIFIITNLSGSVYDMAGSTVVCKLYLTSSPTSIPCSINVPTGEITVPFTAVHTDNGGTFEFILEETTVGSDEIVLIRGNIIVVPYVPFSEGIEAYLRSELPANLTLIPDYRNQRIMYWRRILQVAFEIADTDLNKEAAWPTLVNALLAKLVVYDALMLAASGSFIQFLGGDYTDTTTVGGGGVKSVETGPVRVEYFDTAASAKNAFSSSAGDLSMFEALKQGLCGLANYLGVKVPMCDGNYIPITPKFHRNPDWAYPTLDDMDDSIQGEVSQG